MPLGSGLKEFKQDIAEKAASLEKFRKELIEKLPLPHDHRYRTKPHGKRRADNRRRNKVARIARRQNRRKK